MNLLLLALIGMFPLSLLLFAPTVVGIAAAIGVSVGLGFWMLHGRNANPLFPLSGYIGGLLTQWLGGMLSLDVSTVVPLLGMLVVYGTMMRRSDGVVPSWVLLLTAILSCGIPFLVESGGTEGGSIGPVSRVVIFGDSLTAGVPTDGVDRHWPAILRERLGGNTEVIAHAYPGDTAGGSLDRWADVVQNGRWHPANREWTPELVILLLGGNDILRRRGAGALRQDLERWAGALDRHSGLKVLLIEVPSNPLTGSYRGTWQSVARNRMNYFWTSDRILRGIFGNRALTLPDGIHLNQAGHEALADGVYERLSR